MAVSITSSSRTSFHPVAARALFGRLASYVLVICIIQDVFSGAIRYALNSAGLIWISYIGLVLSCAICVAYSAIRLFSDRPGYAISTAGLFGILIIYSSAVGRSLEEIGFGLYTVSPVFLAAIVWIEQKELPVLRAMALGWLFAVVGVIANRYIAFPWVGSFIDIGGFRIQAALKWYTMENMRLPGFTRASYTAANQILVFSAVLFCLPIGKVAKGLIWGASLVAIYFTTSKTPLIIEAFLPIALIGFNILEHLPENRRIHALNFYTKSVIYVLLGAMILLPLLKISASNALTIQAVGTYRIDSLIDRFDRTWPAAYWQIYVDGNSLEWFLGRGFGGIGAAQYAFDRETANPGDNMFVFMYSSVGLVSALAIPLLVSGYRKVLESDLALAQILFLLATTGIALGITTTSLESIPTGVALGFVAAKARVRYS